MTRLKLQNVKLYLGNGLHRALHLHKSLHLILYIRRERSFCFVLVEVTFVGNVFSEKCLAEVWQVLPANIISFLPMMKKTQISQSI